MPLVRQRLEDGLDALNVTLSDMQINLLLGYIKLMIKWNKSFNLTSVRTDVDIIDRHILDSLACLSLLEGERVIDAGSGAGLPGIPIAIARPSIRVACLDSNGKKTRFLRQVKSHLGLENVEVIHSRLEEFRPPVGYDAVLSRALSDLKLMLDQSWHLCIEGGRFYAMKGIMPTEELEVLGGEVSVFAVHRLNVPGIDEQRHLVVIDKPGLK